MASLFHQNMRIFGGGTPLRNNAYNGAAPPGGAFAAISAAIGGAPVGPIAVAGFTEIANNGAAAGALANSATSLGLGGGAVVGLVACGRTALAHGWEYIGIGVAVGWALVTAGRMLIRADQGIVLSHQRAATFAELNGLGVPANTPDYRGLVYVVVTVPGGGPNVAIGFLHNLYTFQDQRALVAGQLPQMAATMGEAANGLGAVPGIAARYIGGDFNVAMVNPRGTARQGRVYGYQMGLAAVPMGATAGGTTWSGSLYDYWYSSIDPAAGAPAAPFVAPVPSVFANTLNHGPGVIPAGTMSDHAGVSLRFT